MPITNSMRKACSVFESILKLGLPIPIQDIRIRFDFVSKAKDAKEITSKNENEIANLTPAFLRTTPPWNSAIISPISENNRPCAFLSRLYRSKNRKPRLNSIPENANK